MYRERIRYYPNPTGSATSLWNGETGYSSKADDSEFVIDRHGLGDNHNQFFWVERSIRNGGSLSGDTPNFHLDNWVANRYEGRFGLEHLPIDLPGLNEVAVKMLADTNPSAPIVDLPTFILQAGDLPHLLRIKGDSILRKGANLNLKYQFEIKPLASDLSNMALFALTVQRRIKELERLRETGIKKAKRGVKSGTADRSQEVLVNTSHQAYVTTQETWHTKVDRWAFTEWKLDADFPQTNLEGYRGAVKAALGLTIDFATVWELIPWSWLIDWYSNVGDWLMANRNVVGASHGPVGVCTHTKTTVQTHGYNGPSSVRFTPFYAEYETKRRDLVYPSLGASLSPLTNGHASILASLSITRR